MIAWAVRSIGRHRDLLAQMVITDLRGRYVGSSLGLFWTVIHPLVMIVIYTVVFSRIMGARLQGSSDTYAYGMYLCAGLLPWIAFQEAVLRLTTLFPDHAALVRKVAFPKIILYGFVTLTSAINLVLALVVFLAVVSIAGHVPSPSIVLWLPLLAVQLAFALGLGIIASVLHVFIRDTAQIVTVLLQVLFWTTPIVYVETVLPEWLRRLEIFNPLYLFARANHGLVLYGTLPSATHVAVLVLITIVTLAIGVTMYRAFRADILDEL